MVAGVGAGTSRPGMKRFFMVFITYVSCAAFHASRESYVAVKANLQSQLAFPTQLLGTLDTTFLVFYGTGLLFSGSIGARYGNKLVACFGLAGTAVIIAVLGCATKGWIMDLPANGDEAWGQAARFYLPLWALNGLVQSLGFPNLVAVTSGWVDASQRGLILGLWSTTSAAGDIIGLNVATYVLEGGPGVDGAQVQPTPWQNVFFVVAIYLSVTACLLAFLVDDVAAAAHATSHTNETADETSSLLKGAAKAAGGNGATDSGADAEAGDVGSSAITSAEETVKGRPANVFSGFVDAFSVPGVLDWSLSYFFIKTVTYTILFWMPYYLTLTLDSVSAADNLTVLFDVAMIIGTATLGGATDACGGSRSPVFVGSFIVGSLPLLFLPVLQESIPHYAAAFAILGVFTGGPAHMYGTAVSVDLGESAAAMGKPGLVSSLSGLIDGIGTLGAALGQSLVARLASEGERSRKYLSDAIAKDSDMVQLSNETSTRRGGISSMLLDLAQADITSDQTKAADEDEKERKGRKGRVRNETEEVVPPPPPEEADKKLYSETKEHHAGGEKRGLAKVVTSVTEAVTEAVTEKMTEKVADMSASLSSKDPLNVDATSASAIAALHQTSNTVADKLDTVKRRAKSELGRYFPSIGTTEAAEEQRMDDVYAGDIYAMPALGDVYGTAVDGRGVRYYSSVQEYAALGLMPSEFPGRWSGILPGPVSPVFASLGAAALGAGGGEDKNGTGVDTESMANLVDAEFQARWSRVFFMLFCFNLAAAISLLRVAYRDLSKTGFFSGAGGDAGDDTVNVKLPSEDKIPP